MYRDPTRILGAMFCEFWASDCHCCHSRALLIKQSPKRIAKVFEVDMNGKNNVVFARSGVEFARATEIMGKFYGGRVV